MNPETTFAIATAPKRNSLHWKLGTITWGELVSWMATPANRKEAGNYLLGTLVKTTIKHNRDDAEPCTGMHRRKDAVLLRSAITLDVDTPPADFAELVELVFPYAGIMHTTYSSSPDAPRYRLILPTDRDLAPDEYVIAAKAVMSLLGKDAFDPGSSQPERYMFKPAEQEAGWFSHWVLEGDVLQVDNLLADFEEDLSTKPLPKPSKNKRDPFEIDGVIGAFNKAYADWDLLIETYELPYDKVDDDRYQLVGARAVAGMGPIQDTEGFVYSHHANDPAYGRTCSAFDLVRLHRFGELDEGKSAQTPVNKLPSHLAMLDLATTDHRVTAQLVGLDFDDLVDDDGTVADDWRLRLSRTNQGKLKDVIGNWDLIRDNDPVLSGLYFNEFTLTVETERDLPWRTRERAGAVFGRTDRAELRNHIERTYGIRPAKEQLDDLVDTRAAQRWVNPVRDYLDGLVWDGKPRIETCLPGVRATSYTRLVARKSLVAAVARIYEPGVKWDHTLVLYGTEGLGKSWWVDKMARGYSASLGRIDNKDTLLAMQRTWIMISDEGHSLRKGDADTLKEFLTRTSDLVRMPYDRETMEHKRHCVIWSTTNDETFLRRQEGNRRFLIVHCEDKVDFAAMTDDYVDQLWAEAVYAYRAGEPLFLAPGESVVAAEERERYVEEDALGGLIQAYLDTPVPEDWPFQSIEARLQWIDDRAQGFEAEGTVLQDRVCTTQLWVEALGRPKGLHRRTELLEIAEALKRLGWVPLSGRHRHAPYGPQVVFERHAIEEGIDLL